MKYYKKITASLILLSSLCLNAQDITLSSGWNLIGITDKLTDGTHVKMADAINNVDDIEYIIGQNDGMFKASYLSYDSYSSKQFEASRGYWVKLKDGVTSSAMSFEGVAVSFNPDIVSEGWTLVGFESTVLMKDKVSSLNTTNGFNIEYIIGKDDGMFKASYLSYDSYASKQFVEGKGYWLKVSSIDEVNSTIEQPPETPSLDDNETSALSTPPSVPGV